MKLRKFSVRNARSFLEEQHLFLDGDVSIIIGPNGGGKTNLLDAVVTTFKRHLFASTYPVQVQSPPGTEAQFEFRYNDVLNQLVMEKHSSDQSGSQEISLEIEVTSTDAQNMRAIQSDAGHLTEMANRRYRNLSLTQATAWNLDLIPAGTVVSYRIFNESLEAGGVPAQIFLEYMRLYEMDARVREDFKFAQLSIPIMYLPVNRASSGFQSNVGLSGFNEYEAKRTLDMTSSRNGGNYVSLAIGRLASKYRLLLEEDKGRAGSEFARDKNIQDLTRFLKNLGYEWKLETVNIMSNEYSIRLSKQGTSFLVHAASSGERELLTYLFVIFGLNIRDALVVIDEPELHLHPRWQKILLSIFVELSKTTGNQFVIATHSPTFISPESVQYVSRISSLHQRSNIQRLKNDALPNSKHLFNIINSQNNERLFFADAVVLVEGITDRIIFQKLLELRSQSTGARAIIEVVEVGGKGFFSAYEKLLNACQIPYSLIADRDYIEQVGGPALKSLFRVNAKEIKEDVFENVKSIDAATMLAAIDSALETGDLASAREIWSYIKSRRRELREDLTVEEKNSLSDCLKELSQRSVHILREGAIEAYLPSGYKGKDLEKVITLVAAADFWSQLTDGKKDELAAIVDGILARHHSQMGVH